MKTKSNFMRGETYTCDAVIHRGYAIYDEWTANKISSRKIVDRVGHAVSAVKKEKSNAASIEALSQLFALDLRVKERYQGILSCLFRCFSWRRERKALKQLGAMLHITESTDIRTVIELVLQRLREAPEGEDAEGGEDEIHGGKGIGKAEEEAVATKEKADQVVKAEKSKQAIEEKTEEASEQMPTDEKQQSTEPSQDAGKEAVQDESVKKENNGTDKQSELRKEPSKESNTYNEAVDSPPLYEKHESNRSAAVERVSVDETIIDHTVKDKAEFSNRDPQEAVKSEPQGENTEAQKAEDGKSTDKNDCLYDKALENGTGSAAQDLEKTVQENEKNVSVKQEKEDFRVPLQVQMTEDQENDIRREISSNLSREAIEAIYNAQADAMREQLRIASEELGIDAPVVIIGRPEPLQAKKHGAALDKK